jgi:transcriptional regulator with XRE-family HTH domain
MQQVTFYGQLVGQVIRGRREMQQLSLMTMAKSAALASPSGWSRIETGDTSMTLVQLRKAAHTLGMEPSDILRQADHLAGQLQASGVVVHDEKPKDIGRWLLLGGAGILALVAAGAAAAAATNTATNASSGEEDADDHKEKS